MSGTIQRTFLIAVVGMAVCGPVALVLHLLGFSPGGSEAAPAATADLRAKILQQWPGVLLDVSEKSGPVAEHRYVELLWTDAPDDRQRVEAELLAVYRLAKADIEQRGTAGSARLITIWLFDDARDVGGGWQLCNVRSTDLAVERLPENPDQVKWRDETRYKFVHAEEF